MYCKLKTVVSFLRVIVTLLSLRHIKYYFSINLKQEHTFTEHMLTIKIVLTFSMQAFVSRINEFQKRLCWFSNFPGAAVLNN